jgi:hypothetical protein
MQYTIPEINNGVAKVQYSDGTWTFVQLTSDMTEADLDDIVHNITPPHLKTGTTPSFLSAGTTRTAAEKPTEEYVDPRPQYVQDRTAAYGTPEQQLEYITENGLDAWQTKVAQIKTDNPKS